MLAITEVRLFYKKIEKLFSLLIMNLFYRIKLLYKNWSPLDKKTIPSSHKKHFFKKKWFPPDRKLFPLPLGRMNLFDKKYFSLDIKTISTSQNKTFPVNELFFPT